MDNTKTIRTLSDFVAQAGHDQNESVLQIYDEAWNLYRVVSVEPDILYEDEAQALDVQDRDSPVFSLQVRLEMVRRNRI